MSKIKFVYFDLGNVILNFTHQRMVDNVAGVASVGAADVQKHMFDSDLENRYETGELNSQQFHEEFCKAANAECDLDTFIDACGDIFWLKSDIVPVISQLWTANMPLGILSNTCEAHFDAAKRNFQVLSHFFDTEITSYQSKSMKPDPKIYTDAIAAAGVDPQNIFFTDDRTENVEAAVKEGIDAVLFESAAQLTRALRERDILIG
jgi:FMN phosphatase YigB (HAD superfamily)